MPVTTLLHASQGSTSAATASLCLAAITHTYLLFHCFPYLGYMTLTLPRKEFFGSLATSVDVNNVGWYAGLLGTAFTTGRCLGFLPWQKLRRPHHLGVQQSLLLSLALSAACSIWFGMSTTFVSAVTARFCLGLVNTLSGCVKRIAIDRHKHAAQQLRVQSQIVARQASDNDDNDNTTAPPIPIVLDTKLLEELAPARVLDIMWWGSAIGPCIGGALSNPGTYSQNTVLPNWLEGHYPYLLPNLVAAVLCLISLVAVYTFVPTEPSSPELLDSKTIISQPPAQPLQTNDTTGGETQTLLPKENCNPQQQQQPSSSSQYQRDSLAEKIQQLKFVWKSSTTRWHLMAYWSFSFVVVAVDEALPLFLMARLSGPGLSPNQMGWILSAAGFLVVLSQVISIDKFYGEVEDHFYPTLRWMAWMGGVPCVLIPVMILLNGGTYSTLMMEGLIPERDDLDHNNNADTTNNNDDQIPNNYTTMGALLVAPGILRWGAFLYLALLTGWMRICSTTYFGMIGIAAGRTVPPGHRDSVARIMTLGALCARAVAPVVAGAMVSIFMTARWGFNTEADAFILWAVIGLVFGLGAAMITFQLNCPSEGKEGIAARSKRQNLYLDNRERAQVFAHLWEVHYDKDSLTVAAKWRRLVRKVVAMNRMKKDLSTAVPKEVTDDFGRRQSSVKYKRTSWIDHVVRPGIDVDSTSFFILGTHKDDKDCLPHVLTPPLMEALHNNLPMACSADNFWLLYSLVRDGASMDVLEMKLLHAKNTIIAIETVTGDVFGCYMKHPWQKTGRYEMNGESFLWRLKQPRSAPTATGGTLEDGTLQPDEKTLDEIAQREGDIEIYRWTGENDNCMLFGHDRLAVGGGMTGDTLARDGFGFIVEDLLSRGSSSPCQTYDNPCLVSSEDGTFEVANMEVWCMTPFLFSSEAEESMKTIRFIQQNMTNTKGDAPSAAQSAWTQFL